MDEVARYNIARWQALAEANAPFSRPLLELDAASARAFLDPEGLLGELAGQEVLCLAGGGGNESVAFALLGARATVLDLSAEQLEQDRRAALHYGLEVETLRGDMRDLSALYGREFDVVTHSYSINFVPDARPVFREVARVLRRGGVLFVNVPNETGLFFRAGNIYQKLRRRGWSVNLAPTFDPYHVFGFSRRALRALLSKHGLEIRVCSFYAGRAVLPRKAGLFGALEHFMARAVLGVSKIGSLGAYVEVWAVKL